MRCGTEPNSPTSPRFAFVRSRWPVDVDTQMDRDSPVATMATIVEQRHVVDLRCTPADAGVAELVDAGDLKAHRKGRQVNVVLACRPLCFPRIPRSTVIYDGSGHPGGHIFPCASTVQVASCASAASGMGGPELSWLSVFLGEKRNGGGNGGQVPAGHFASGHRDSGGVAKRVRRLTSRRERAAGQCSLGLPPWGPMGTVSRLPGLLDVRQDPAAVQQGRPR